MTKRYLYAAIALVTSLCVLALVYNFLLWHFFRGYNEVYNMFVWPVVGILTGTNVLLAGAIWLYRRFRSRSTTSPLVVALLLAAVITLCSPLFAPSVGRFANRNRWIDTPLIEAARYGDAPVVIVLLKNGADPNEKQPALGTTSLHYMAARGEMEAVDLLLSKGADPNARANTSLETPLHWAVEARTNLETIRALVKNGALSTLTDWEDKTPVDYTQSIPEPQASTIREAMTN